MLVTEFQPAVFEKSFNSLVSSFYIAADAPIHIEEDSRDKGMVKYLLYITTEDL